MTVQITTYAGLQAAIAAWLARDGDSDIASRADDFLALCETRIYYGAEALPGLGIPEHQALRIPELEQSNTSFALSNGVAQPGGLLELIEATLNSPLHPLDIVEQSVIDSYRDQSGSSVKLIAASGTTFRFWPDPGSGNYTATLRWYGKLMTPSGTNPTNWILSNAPGVYLNGCLLEAAIFTQDADAAKLYAMLYGAAINGLNNRKNRILASAQNLKMRVRGRTP